MIQRIEPASRMSQAVRYGDTIFLAGQVGESGEDFAMQVEKALSNVDRLLADAGTDRSRLLQATIWLADRGDYARFNEIWEAWLDGAPSPTRATAIIGFPDPGYRVEVIVTAAADTRA